MDLKLREYIFEMFNYKIRQKKIDFFKITNPYPALKDFMIKCLFIWRLLESEGEEWRRRMPSQNRVKLTTEKRILLRNQQICGRYKVTDTRGTKPKTASRA